jgi:hypothetical protein
MGRLDENDEVDESWAEVGSAGFRGAVLVISSADVLQALRAHGVVQWARISVGRDPLDSLVRPPMISWRYVEPRTRVGAGIASVVREFKGNVEWVIDLSGRNWVLIPKRLQEEFSGAPEGYVRVLSNVKNSDQEFCIRATEDLMDLMGRVNSFEEM